MFRYNGLDLCACMCFLAPSCLGGRCGEALLILTECFIFYGFIFACLLHEWADSISREDVFDDVRWLWKMTPWSNWLLWNVGSEELIKEMCNSKKQHEADFCRVKFWVESPL